jgi:Cof subfamily protein (haloacid dehalogenase superfamily)
MPIRLVAIDIDGTLLDSRGGIPEANRRALAAAAAQGVAVMLVTGRSRHSAGQIATRLEVPVSIICSNGALVCAPDLTVRLRRTMAADVARRVLVQTHAFRSDVSLLFDRADGQRMVSGGIDWTHPLRAGYYAKNREIISEVVPLEEALTEDPLQVMFNGPLERMRELVALLTANHGRDGGYHVVSTEYPRRDLGLVDVLAEGVSKGRTLTAWAAGLGLARDELMAIGDNYNDLCMLEAVGQPVVMGNAVPELLSAGFPITASNDDGGLALAIEQFALEPGRAEG